MRFSYSVYSTHPRLLFRSIADMQTRSNNSLGWKSLYDNVILPSAATLESSYSVSQIGSDVNGGHVKTLTLALCGVIQGSATYRQKAMDVAKWHAQNAAGTTSPYGDWTATQARRVSVLLMAYVYDILYNQPEMTSGNKAILISGLKISGDICLGAVNPAGGELIDGHAAGHAMACLCAGIALGADDAKGATYRDAALNFWYGTNAGDPGRIDTDRHFGQNGGNGKGAWYAILSQWYTQLFLHMMYYGFLQNSDTPGSLLLDTQPYAPFVDEDWVQKVGEWYIRHGYRGDWDYLNMGDTSKITNPVFHEWYHGCLSGLIDQGGTWRSVLHWLWTQLYNWQVAKGQLSGWDITTDFCLFDKAASGVAPVHPKDASIALSKLTLPPGDYHCVYPEFDPPNACSINISLEEYDYRGHKHRDCGLIQISLKNDMVLLNSGYYNPSDYAAQFGGTHNNNWGKQSISKSGVPLVEGVASNDSDKHYNWDAAGSKIHYYNGLGGQCWKSIGGRDGQWLPDSISDMLTAGGGLAFKRCTSNWQQLLGADFLYSDIRHAYLKEYTHLDTDYERTRIAKVRMLVITGVSPWPVIFRVVHLKSRLTTMKKRDHWHFATQPVFEGGGPRFRALGPNGSAWCAIEYYNPQEYTYTTIGGGAQSDGYGEYDFYWNGMNWRPTSATTWRTAIDIGHYRVEVSPGTPKEEDYLVCLISPFLGGESPVAYTFFEETNYFGVNFSGATYRIHKTLDQAVVGMIDTEPPGVPQDPTGVAGPGSGQATLDCTPNSDDTKEYWYYKRVKV